jgi:hypothetical protein
MKRKVLVIEKIIQRNDKPHPVKVTSLDYLKEALREEDYEACPAIIRIASEFGASGVEIDEVLGHAVKWDRSSESALPQWMSGIYHSEELK